MKILQRYIAKAVIGSTLLVLVVVTALNFIIGMLRELKNIGEGDYGFFQIILHEILLLPHEVYQFFPMLVLLGGVIGLGSLATSHELMVMRTAGVSVGRIIFAVAKTALVLIFFATLIGELAAPRTNFLAEKYKSLAETMGQAVVTLSGVWIHEGSNFIHINSVVGKHRLEGVTRYEFNAKHRLLAAYYSPSLYFEDGVWHSAAGVKTTINGDRTLALKYTNAVWDIKLTPNLLNVGLIDAEAMSLQKLAAYSRYLKENKLQAGVFQLELWQRIFQPFTTLVMTLLAIPFVFTAPRSSSMGRRILFAIIIGFIFYVLNAFFAQFSLVFQFHPMLAAILPSILFAIGGLIWMRKTNFT
jgi:lipopolysaccharide export system permease protein